MMKGNTVNVCLRVLKAKNENSQYTHSWQFLTVGNLSTTTATSTKTCVTLRLFQPLQLVQKLETTQEPN